MVRDLLAEADAVPQWNSTCRQGSACMDFHRRAVHPKGDNPISANTYG
jgi:hypothetical protein